MSDEAVNSNENLTSVPLMNNIAWDKVNLADLLYVVHGLGIDRDKNITIDALRSIASAFLKFSEDDVVAKPEFIGNRFANVSIDVTEPLKDDPSLIRFGLFRGLSGGPYSIYGRLKDKCIDMSKIADSLKKIILPQKVNRHYEVYPKSTEISRNIDDKKSATLIETNEEIMFTKGKNYDISLTLLFQGNNGVGGSNLSEGRVWAEGLYVLNDLAEMSFVAFLPEYFKEYFSMSFNFQFSATKNDELRLSVAFKDKLLLRGGAVSVVEIG